MLTCSSFVTYSRRDRPLARVIGPVPMVSGHPTEPEAFISHLRFGLIPWHVSQRPRSASSSRRSAWTATRATPSGRRSAGSAAARSSGSRRRSPGASRRIQLLSATHSLMSFPDPSTDSLLTRFFCEGLISSALDAPSCDSYSTPPFAASSLDS